MRFKKSNCRKKMVFSQPDVLQLGEVAEIEAQMFSFVQKFKRRTAVEFSTEPAILPNCCVCPASAGHTL